MAKAAVMDFPGTGTHMQAALKASKRKPIGMQMEHERDPAEETMEKLGDISRFSILNTYVLYAVYERPKKTKGGVYLTDATTAEDEYQGKAGLVIAVGPMVNDNEAVELRGEAIEPGDWIAVRPADGWAIKVNGVLCRMINEKGIHMKIPTPDSVW